MAELGEVFSDHSPRIGMGRDLNLAWAKLSELMTAARWYKPIMLAQYAKGQGCGGPNHSGALNL